MMSRVLMPFVLVLIMRCLVISLSIPSTTVTDEAALLAFKAHITFDPNNILATNWSTSSSICNWIGVTCSTRRHQRVAALNLSDTQLEGTIPPDIGNLSFLASLNLSNNRFHGFLPPELSRLHRLKIMDLGYNNFSGEVPPRFSLLLMLQHLFLNDNLLTGEIPNKIGELQNLRELDMSNNNITGSIPSGLFNLSMLRKVNLAENHLSGVVPSNTGLWLPKLEELFLEQNQLSGQVPNSIGNASSLVVLDLSFNSFSGLIPDSLGNLKNLKRLNLAENLLTSKSTTQGLSLFSTLSNCRHLELIRINGNPLGGSLLSIRNLSTSLQEFYVYDCKIEGSIPREIGNLSNLIGLILQNNELTETMPSEIGKLLHLQDFSVRHNKLQGSIPNEMCHLQRLGYFFLAENDFSGAIPECWSNLTFLREMYFGFNRFTSLPSSLWRLHDMLIINMTSNSLSGSIPSEIQNLKVLRKIDFSRNQLSGNIPISIGGLQNLAYLFLSENRLEGPIPESLGDLVSLVYLDLSSNNLSGVIPKSLEKLLHLDYLNVSFNELQGEIPSGGPFSNFSVNSFMGNEALCWSKRQQGSISVCKGTTATSKTAKIVLRYVLPTTAVITLVLVSVITLLRHKWKAKPVAEGDLSFIPTWRRISHYDLDLATDGFQESNLLGAGSFGSVYKGTLSDGTNVAVKVFNLQLEGAFKSFDVECEVLSNLRHRNLVKIITSCSNDLDFRALVLEFMPRGSLEQWLYSDNCFLNFLQRLNIMIDVASALEYLHHHCATAVVHCDLKPSNVLIDENMVAHVGDFGIAKVLTGEDCLTHTLTLATIGYMPPEYGLNGIVSENGDVYSYGILLMETFTGKKPVDEIFAGEMNLKQWVQKSLVSDAITEVVDTNMLRREEQHFESKKGYATITSLLELALLCSADLAEERMHMKDVVIVLKKIRTTFLKDIGPSQHRHR